jgi:XRE family aerobic/anaerobic benzoate catabolism transcriptional regulator
MTAEILRQDEEGFAEVGERVRAARAKTGMTRKQLATASGTSERYLAVIEAGDGNPSLSVLSAIAGALDFPMAELLPLGGERTRAMARALAAVRRLPPGRLPALHDWIDGARGQRNAEKGQRIVLIGLRGAGKSSLGSRLSKLLKLPFFDISKEVESAYGGDIGLLIELNGQGALRRHEAEVWETIRASHDAAVIAAPGGIVADGPLWERVLSTAHCIWLQATPEDHMERVMGQGDFRPMGSSRGAMADLKAILEARAAEYARADVTLDTSAAGSFEQTLELLESTARSLITP